MKRVFNNLHVTTAVKFTISRKPERYHLVSEPTAEKTLLSDQLAGHVERLHIIWFIIKVNKLQRFSRERATEQQFRLCHKTRDDICSITRSSVWGNKPEPACSNEHMPTHRSVQHCGDKVVSNALHLKSLIALLLWLNALRVHSNYLK